MTTKMTTDWRINIVLYLVSPLVAFCKWLFDGGNYFAGLKYTIKMIKGE